MKRRVLYTLALAAALSSLASAQFTSGNLAVSKVDGQAAALSSSAAQASLMQFDKVNVGQAGSTIVLFPSTAGGQMLTNSGSATSEGHLSLSTNGQFLSYQGYNAAFGTATVSTAAGIGRVHAQVDAAGNVVYTNFTDGFTNNSIRSSFIDGSTFYAGGTGTGGGVRQGTIGAGTTTQISGTLANARVVQFYNGLPYFTAQSGAFIGLNVINPTGTSTNLFTYTSANPYGFYFVDSNNVFVADEGASVGIQRFTFNGTSWVQSGQVLVTNAAGANVGVRGLAGETISGVTNLYAITAESASNRLIKISDALGGSQAQSTLATAGTNTLFRGVALTPVPEPGVIVAFGFGVAGIAALRRRRR